MILVRWKCLNKAYSFICLHTYKTITFSASDFMLNPSGFFSDSLNGNPHILEEAKPGDWP